jgi:hypothetical protein
MSIPLGDTHTLPSSKLVSGELNRGKIVLGKYAAIERVTRLPDGRIEWLTGTESDAGGNLPRWLQEKSVPGQILKDVGLFIGWADKKRTA